MLNDLSIKSEMLTKLLMFLIMKRFDIVSKEEIANNLWEEDESDDPMGALKNLTYRLRKVLNSQLGEDDYIITARGVLKWNENIDIITDFEEFLTAFSDGNNENAEDLSKIESLEKCILIYSGDFMTKISDLHWVATQLSYFRSKYIEAAIALAKLYDKHEMYSDLERMCIHVLSVYHADETIYYYLIKARAKVGKKRLAIETYETAIKQIKKELGISGSEILTDIYKAILSADGDSMLKDIEEAKEEMGEFDPGGVFMCGYEVFKIIYQLEARRMSRLGISEFVLLLSLLPQNYKEGEFNQIQKAMVKNAMPKMEKIIMKALRTGDVVAKYSESQYIMLLPSCDFESGMIVANRLSGEFYQNTRNIRVDCKLQDVSSDSI
ncbi:MAG: winged helix-turn-helix domain-containing protein [Eubacterium sp.]|nr:winged helix-turn-helix domain-containing protein [Eubacterium sp.]